MKTRTTLMGAVLGAALLLAASVRAEGNAAKAGGLWTAEWRLTTTSLRTPECALPDAKNGVVYISNVEPSGEGYWEDNSRGFISKTEPDGRMRKRWWIGSTRDDPFNGPKGMCILDDYLYIADNRRLLRVELPEGKRIERIRLPVKEKLNDLATDGKFVYLTDTGIGTIYRIDKMGRRFQLKAPQGVNGITCSAGKIFAVSYDLHDVYEIEPSGRHEPLPFGLAEHFTGLDGIEVLDDGTFIVSDFLGNKVFTISPNRKRVRTLIKLDAPADIGLDRTRNLLYVPQFMKDQFAVYELRKEGTP